MQSLAPAFVEQIKSHSGYSGCDKCTQPGVWKGKMTFPETTAPLRTYVQFNEMQDEDRHIGASPLVSRNIGILGQFPIDYMHLVCLDVMRRLLNLSGLLPTRLKSSIVNDISSVLIGLQGFIPNEFARKPRSLRDVDRWKATEDSLYCSLAQ